jgi:cytochrome c oxidase assembly protein subunit 15
MSLVMTSLSSFIRLADSGIGCEPWPECQAVHFTIDDQPGITIASGDKNKGLRVLHRFMASAFGLVAILLVVLSIWYRKVVRTPPTLAIICFILTVILALVGMNTPDLLHPIVTLTNLTAGMVTTAVLWILALRLQTPLMKGGPAGLYLLNLINIYLVIMVIASGAWISANFASGACEGFLDCGVISGESFLDAFNPMREIQLVGDELFLGDVQSTIEWSHHLAAVLLCVSLALSCYKNSRYKNSSYKNFATSNLTTLVIIGLTVGLVVAGTLESGAGLGNESRQPTLLSAWIHNFWSMLLLLAVVYQYFQMREKA